MSLKVIINGIDSSFSTFSCLGFSFDGPVARFLYCTCCFSVFEHVDYLDRVLTTSVQLLKHSGSVVRSKCIVLLANLKYYIRENRDHVVKNKAIISKNKNKKPLYLCLIRIRT